MNKREFLMELERRLDFMGVEERNDVLRDYIEHFESGKRVGRSEKEIAEDLGSIDEIVDQFEDKSAAPRKSVNTVEGDVSRKESGGKERRGSVIGAIFYGFGMTVAIIVLFSLCIGGMAACFGLTVGGAVYIVAPFVILSNFALSIGVALASFGILILSICGIKGMGRAFKGVFLLIKTSFIQGKNILTGGKN